MRTINGPEEQTTQPQSIAANSTQPASIAGENGESGFVTFDPGRKHLARIVAVNGKKVTVRRFNKKTGDWQTKNESREREACIPLTAAEAEESFPGCVAAWDKAQSPTASGGKVTRQMSPNLTARVVAAPPFQSVADFISAYSEKKKTIDDLTNKFVDRMGEAKQAQDEIIPHLAFMQAILSKKGTHHHFVIAARKRGRKIPWWTEYYESYRDRLWESLRTMERRIAKYRNDPTEREPKSERDPIPRLSKADRKRLIEGNHRANELVAVLEAGHDAKKEIADFRAVMDARRLDDIIQVQEREFEYVDFLNYSYLEPVGASLKVWNDWYWGAHGGSIKTVLEMHDALKRLRKNGFPYYSLTKKEKLEELRELLRHGPAPITIDGEVIQTMHAQGFCWSYHPHSWEVRCNGMLTPMEIFRNEDKLWEVLEERALYGSVRSLIDSEIRKGLKSATGAQGVSGFRPSAAWAIYDIYCPDNATVYDPSGGWGGRLLGAVACSKVKKYIACEPATKTFAGLTKMKNDLKRMLPDRRLQVELHKIGSEDFKPAPGTVDCTVWSPPYFEGDGVVEEYSVEKSQSHVRFPDRESWLSGYFAATLANVFAALKPGATLVLNVSESMKPDATALAAGEGFALVREMRYAISRIWGSKDQGEGPTWEPLLVLAKPD